MSTNPPMETMGPVVQGPVLPRPVVPGPVLPPTSQLPNAQEAQPLGEVKISNWVDRVSLEGVSPNRRNPHLDSENLDVSRTISTHTESSQAEILQNNNSINNGTVEENSNGLKNMGIAGFDSVLLANNATQLFYLIKGNNWVFPGTPQSGLLSVSIVLHVLVLGLICYDAFFCSNQSRNTTIVVNCLMVLIAVVNFVLDWAPLDFL